MSLDFEKASGLDFVERARAVVPVIAAASAEIERDRQLPELVVSALHEAELYRMLLPASYGGGELDLPSYVRAIEVLAQADASVAWCVAQASGCSTVAAVLRPEAARRIFTDPRAVLAWGPPHKGAATATEGGYRLTGNWQFASGSRQATWIGAHVPIREADGTPRLHAGGAPVMRTMLFPRAGAAFVDTWQVMGLRGTGSDEYAATDLFVEELMTAPRDHVEPFERGPLYVFSHMIVFAASFAAISLGLARASLDAFVRLARDKQSKGMDVPLRESAVVQLHIGTAEARLRAARAFLFESLSAAWDDAERTGSIALDLRFAQRMAATHAIREGRDVVDVVYDAAGASAIFEANPFERRFRDVHAVTQQVQSHLSHLENAGKYLLGAEFSSRYI